jgi:hypothetical protein
MAVEIRYVTDAALTAEWMTVLHRAGFAPVLDGGVLHLSGVGVAHGDRSVDLMVRLIEMDGHRVLAFEARIRCEPAGFDVASLAAIRGSSVCRIANISVTEMVDDDRDPHLFGLTARFHLYADHLSETELTTMLRLFIKEVDEVDNELATIMLGR